MESRNDVGEVFIDICHLLSRNVNWLVFQEKAARLKKLRDAVDEEIEQETRKAKIDKESAIK